MILVPGDFSSYPVFHSAVSQISGSQPQAADEIAMALARIANFACGLTTRPTPSWPWPLLPIPFTTNSAVDLAGGVRKQLGMDDLSPAYELAALVPEKLSVLVFSIGHPEIESAVAMLDGTMLIFIANDLGFTQLRCCARELAFLLALSSRCATGSCAHVSLRRSLMGRSGPKEYFASNFASELLVPTRGLAVALRRVRQLLKVKNRAIGDIELLYLARIFGVTFSDVARKCERAQLLPLGSAAVMEKFLGEKFGGPEKRATDLGLPDRPAVPLPIAPAAFLATLSAQIAAGMLSGTEAAQAFGVSEYALDLALTHRQPTLQGLWQ